MQPTLTKLLAGLVVQNSYGSQKQNGTLILILKHDSGNSEICHHLEVNVIIIQENDLLGNLEKRIFVGTNEFTCICEEICFYIEASSQDQRAHKEYQQTEFTFAEGKKY